MFRFVLVLLLVGGGIVVAQRAPNLVLIVTDDQRADGLGCAGHPFVQTPHIDALAQRGVRFVNGFVTTPICAASRASILTGTWEGTHRCTFGTPPLDPALARDAWPRLLRSAGYRTGFVGKWGVRTTPEARDAMWDSFRGLRAPYLRTGDGGEMRHLTEITVDHAIEFVRGVTAERPFCLLLSFNAPHAEDSNPAQYIPAPSLRQLYDDVTVPTPALSDAAFFDSLPAFQRESLNRIRWHWRFDTVAKRERMVRDYCAMITGVDRAVGRLLDELHAVGVAEDTVVLFTSDNGCFLGERGFAGKWTIHEPSIRVPMIVHDPRGAQPDNRVLDPIVLNVDLAPTLLDLAGVAIPESCQGRSLVPLLQGEQPTWREDFFCEHLFEHEDIAKNEGVRSRQWAYTRYFEQQPVFEELYDLVADPTQRVNLAADPEHIETLESMRLRCDELKLHYRR